MPKLLVLIDPRADDMAPLADAIAEGARRVRFAEVDVRSMAHATPNGTPAPRHRTLESADTLADYDGIVVGAAHAHAGGDGAIDVFAATTANLVNRVGSVFVARSVSDRSAVLWAGFAPMADRGMILVPPMVTGSPGDELESAREHGKRVADVIGWVTHARSHHHH